MLTVMVVSPTPMETYWLPLPVNSEPLMTIFWLLPRDGGDQSAVGRDAGNGVGVGAVLTQDEVGQGHGQTLKAQAVLTACSGLYHHMAAQLAEGNGAGLGGLAAQGAGNAGGLGFQG